MTETGKISAAVVEFADVQVIDDAVKGVGEARRNQ